MATAPAPLTVDEIHVRLAEREARYPGDKAAEKLHEAIDKAFDTVAYVDCDAEGHLEFGDGDYLISDLWADLRPSERDRLGQLVVEGKARAALRAQDAIHEEVTAAALAFAAEYPDAPRATGEATT